MILIAKWENSHLDQLGTVVLQTTKLLYEPAVLILTGDVGTGKTTFVQAFIKNLYGLHDNSFAVSSPTYSIINEFEDVVYADFYRLESDGELTFLELPLYLSQKRFFLVEWGKEFARTLYRVIEDENFSFYELEITMSDMNGNDVKDDSFLRTYVLKKLDWNSQPGK